MPPVIQPLHQFTQRQRASMRAVRRAANQQITDYNTQMQQ